MTEYGTEADIPFHGAMPVMSVTCDGPGGLGKVCRYCDKMARWWHHPDNTWGRYEHVCDEHLANLNPFVAGLLFGHEKPAVDAGQANTRISENITHWRELTNGLTASQIDTLERAEKLGNCTADLLLDVARDSVAENLVEAMFADVPGPAGAEKVYRWVDDGDGQYVRFCTLHRAEVAEGRVEVAAMQHSCGHAENFILVHDVEQLDAFQARELAAALQAAAEKLERG